MGKVVNIHRGEDYEVYIGRAGNGKDGYFGNPFNEGTRTYKLKMFEQYLKDRINNDEEFRENVKSLNGKVLGCFCSPKPCHGDILLKYAKLLEI